jgi:hypothetical protein
VAVQALKETLTWRCAGPNKTSGSAIPDARSPETQQTQTQYRGGGEENRQLGNVRHDEGGDTRPHNGLELQSDQDSFTGPARDTVGTVAMPTPASSSPPAALFRKGRKTEAPRWRAKLVARVPARAGIIRLESCPEITGRTGSAVRRARKVVGHSNVPSMG